MCLLTGLILWYYSRRSQPNSATSYPKEATLKRNIECMRSPKKSAPHILSALYVDLLPHLKKTDQKCLDHVLIKQKNVFRSPASILIAIPSTYRKDVNYLFGTLSSLFTNLMEEERYLVQFIVILAEHDLANPVIEKYVNGTIEGICRTYPREVEDGLIEVIRLPAEWYPPDLSTIPPTYNESQQRMTWRTKQNLNYAYLIIYARTSYPHFKYYVQLEDDVETIPKYVPAMEYFGDTHSGWVMCEFSKLGFIGKMFRYSDLVFVTQFILLLYREIPVDWILDQLFYTKYCPSTDKKKLVLHYSFTVLQPANENNTVIWPVAPPLDVFIKYASVDTVDYPRLITKLSYDFDSMFLRKFIRPVNISQISVKLENERTKLLRFTFSAIKIYV